MRGLQLVRCLAYCWSEKSLSAIHIPTKSEAMITAKSLLKSAHYNGALIYISDVESVTKYAVSRKTTPGWMVEWQLPPREGDGQTEGEA